MPAHCSGKSGYKLCGTSKGSAINFVQSFFYTGCRSSVHGAGQVPFVPALGPNYALKRTCAE